MGTLDRAGRPARALARQLRLALPLALLLMTVVMPRLSAQDEFCYHPANLSANCDMEHFSDRAPGGDVRIVGEGWGFWVEAGNPAFDIGYDSPRPPSQRVWSDGAPFTAGMFQRIEGLTPGATYRAGVVWAPYTAPDGSMMRQIGLDPTGGSDPFAPEIQWGVEQWGFSRMTLLETRAVATAPAMTIFVRIHHPQSFGADQIFIDGIWMRRDESAPVVPPSPEPPPSAEPPPSPEAPPSPEPPTPTAAPSTETPVPPTATPPATATPRPTEPAPSVTPSISPSRSPTPRPAASATTTPMPPTPPPSSPTRSATPVVGITPTPAAPGDMSASVVARDTRSASRVAAVPTAGRWGLGGAIAVALAAGLWFAGRGRYGRR